MPVIAGGGGASQIGPGTRTLNLSASQATYCSTARSRRLAPLPVIVTTWNPADAAAAFTLSNDNLTATEAGGSADKFLRATSSKSFGKWYFETTFTTVSASGATILGFANATPSVASAYYLGSDLNSLGYFNTGGWIGNSGSISAFALWTTTPVVIGAAIDLNAGKVWFAKDGAWQNGDPAAGTGGFTLNVSGALYPALSDTADVNATANFGATPFAYTAPADFYSWDTTGGALSWTDIAGTSATALTDTATLLGLGSVTGTSTATFAHSGAILGKGAVTGSSAATFTETGTVLGKGALTGTSATTFSLSATVTGKGSLTGANSPSFSATGALLGRGGLTGASAVTFTPSGAVAGAGALSGATSDTFAANGSLLGAGALTGSANPAFALSGLLNSAGTAVTPIVAAVSVTFTLAATLRHTAWAVDQNAAPAEWDTDADAPRPVFAGTPAPTSSGWIVTKTADPSGIAGTPTPSPPTWTGG